MPGIIEPQCRIISDAATALSLELLKLLFKTATDHNPDS
jgi:hypothetical protein